MPNWCKGTLRIHGLKKNLQKFVLEGLQPVDLLGEDLDKLKLDEDGDIEYQRKPYNCWIKGTYRGFVSFNEVWFPGYKDDVPITIAMDAQFALGIDATELQKACKEYGIDMRIYAFEQGMEFNQNIEILNGIITKDENLKFDDYIWDCICPNIGG